MQPHHKPLSLWITMEKIPNLGKRVNFCLRLFSCNLTRSIWGTCFYGHLIPLYLLLSPLRSSEQQEFPRETAWQQGMGEPLVQFSLLTEPRHLTLTIGWWHSLGLDALLLRPTVPTWILTFNIAHLTLCSLTLVLLGFPFLKLGISASPHGTYGLQAAGN